MPSQVSTLLIESFIESDDLVNKANSILIESLYLTVGSRLLGEGSAQL